jgi:hypothetical protein
MLLVHSIVALIAGLSAATCDDDTPIAPDDLVVLEVTTQPWSSWTEEQLPPTTAEYHVAAGQQVILQTGSTPVALDIEIIDDDGVSIRTQGVAIVPPSGDIDLFGCGEQTMGLAEDESVELATCTLDGGTYWTVTNGP